MLKLSGANVYRDGHFELDDLLVKDGRVFSIVTPDSMKSIDLYKFADSKAVENIKLNNCYIFPGFVDVHVHLREPGFLYKEDILSGTAAAAHGGYTTVLSMPNLNPAPDSIGNLKLQLDAIKKKAKIKVYPYGTITCNEEGIRLSDMEGMADMVAAFSDDGHGVQDEGIMEQAMLKAKSLGKIITAHCEDNELLGGKHIHDGLIAKKLGIQGISSMSEWKQIERDLKLVSKTGCRYHVCHVSTKESVELIRQAKAEGLDVTCETAPHYLLLSEMDFMEYLAEHKSHELGNMKMNPPLRSFEDREALRAGIVDGTIDMIATDHAPHSLEEKRRGIEESPMGIVGLETAFPLLYTYLVRDRIISLEKLIELMCINPAKRFNLTGKNGGAGFASGGIHTGITADLTVFDLSKEYVIDSENFASRGRATPFNGWNVKGECVLTMVDGRIVYTAE